MAASDSTGSASSGSGTSRLDDATQVAKDSAGELWDSARANARAALDERKDAAAQGLHEVAGNLRSSAQQHEPNGQTDIVSGLTGSAAEGLERLSNTLRQKDVRSMLHDVDRFAHQQPLAFFGLAMAAGFATVRFLRASQDDVAATHKSATNTSTDNVRRSPAQTSASSSF